MMCWILLWFEYWGITLRCMNTLYTVHSSALLCPVYILNVSCSTVPDCGYRWSYDTELTGVHGRGHRAQLNLRTKRSSLLMTQWDLPVRACSMPAAVSADAQLSGKTLWPQQHKGSPARTFSQLQLFTSKASLFTTNPGAVAGWQERESGVVSEGPLFTVSQCAPSCGWCLQLQSK